ncbi:hypothetical protein GCM10008995_07520 [Halobellus salinus]|uniref:Type IV pilin n=1 Tax=Halobellus salinus TaxID=931585 RepID=A0A830ED29_9EURY|nr:hypothetical protein [Halobellus salinus]GGJ00178.1 hypothetical protein GCM10008995_07520 [Halobellus salinus]
MRRESEGSGRACGSDRGVSETVSFVLVFALVVASVGTVYAVGVSELEATRDAERVENAQRAFDVLADTLDDLLDGAPSRGTEVKLAAATLRSADDAAVNITVTSADGAQAYTAGEISVSPLVYDVQAGGQVRLSNGAVLRDSARGGASVVRGPPVVVDDDRVLLTIIKQEHVGSDAVGGDRTVRIRMDANRPRRLYGNESVTHESVHVNTTTPYTDAWARHYESVGFDCTEVDDPGPDAPGMVSCTVEDVDRVTVVWLRVTTEFE